MQPYYFPRLTDLLAVLWTLGLPLLGLAVGPVLVWLTKDRGWLLLSLVSGARLALSLAGILLFALLGAAMGFAMGFWGLFPVPN